MFNYKWGALLNLQLFSLWFLALTNL